MKDQNQEIKINDLVYDDLNANQGTEQGAILIQNSLEKLGAGRSVLIDKNGRIIAGNKTIEHAKNAGIEDVVVVETTGNKIVAVKRVDIDLDSAKGRELAIADNATAAANLSWNQDHLNKISDEWSINPEEWNIELPNLEVKEYKEKEIDGEIETEHECPSCGFKY